MRFGYLVYQVSSTVATEVAGFVLRYGAKRFATMMNEIHEPIGLVEFEVRSFHE